MNSRFQNALNGIAQRVPPIWFMRQAGRYHSHYQALRKSHSFTDLCRKPDLAAEVALGPVLDFDFDVAILFSDILFPLDALGMGLSFDDGHGPKLSWHLTEENISRLGDPEEAYYDLFFQKEALQLTRQRLASDKSLIAFVGGPFTLFAYAVEGSHAKGLHRTKQKLHLFEIFCEKILPLLSKNIVLQLEGGAELVMIFDTAAGELSPQLFHEVVVPGLEILSNEAHGQIAYYARGVGPPHLAHPFFASHGLKGIGVDHRWNLNDAFAIRRNGFVQGNFDEALLGLSEAEFKPHLEQFISLLSKFSPEERKGWVCGLGHGVLPSAREENVRLFVEGIRKSFS